MHFFRTSVKNLVMVSIMIDKVNNQTNACITNKSQFGTNR